MDLLLFFIRQAQALGGFELLDWKWLALSVRISKYG
jgi:hypothetical protein